MEKEFNNYKEKQRYYAQKSKESTQFFVSAMPLNTRQNAKKVKENILIKGRTYRKGDENGKI